MRDNLKKSRCEKLWYLVIGDNIFDKLAADKRRHLVRLAWPD